MITHPTSNLPEKLIQQIESITEDQIDELLLLISRRFHQLRPEQEGVFLILSQDPKDRDEELKKYIQLLRLPKTRA